MPVLLPSSVDAATFSISISIMGRSPPRLLRLSCIRPDGLRQRHLPNAQIVKSITNEVSTKVDYTEDEKSLGGGALPGNADARNSSRILDWRPIVFVSGLAVAGYALWNGYLWLALFIGVGFLAISVMLRRVSARNDNGEPIEVAADHGIPHCKWKKVEGGFDVWLKRMPEGIYRLQLMANANIVGALMALVVLAVGVPLWAIFGGTHTQVRKDWIIIGRAKLKRASFGQFCLHHTLKIPGNETTLAILGYTYGNRKFAISGCWDEGEADEVASALNRFLRLVPQSGDENRPSPAQLRAVRASDY
jgi:hypothetical protein